MKLIVSHTSALDLLREMRWQKRNLPPAGIRTLNDCAHSLSEVRGIFIPAFDQSEKRLEVLVGDTAHALKSEEHVCRVLKVDPIAGMFCKVGNRAYTVSPEMLFVQMATRMPLIDLILLGMELCGTYAPCPFSNRFDERPPITSVSRLASFCERASGMRGAATAAKALRWVVDGSNSPAETALVLYLCLPIRLGGYGFTFPDMNPETPLGKRASKMLDHPTMRCDLHWVDERVVIEYDSDQEHLSSQSASRDAVRRNVLGYKDVTVITVRKPMIATPKAFDGVVRQLARALKRRLRTRDMEFTVARSNLRTKLFPWVISDRPF